MSKRFVLLVVLVMLTSLAPGCFFFIGPRKEPITWKELEAKQRVTFAAPYDRVWDAALAALSTQKLGEVDKESGLISTRETNISASKLDTYAWDPNYTNFRYYSNSRAMDDARYWINIKLSKIAEDTTRVQITPNFEIHTREWTWDSTSAMVWKRVRSKGVMEDVIAGRIAKELGQ